VSEFARRKSMKRSICKENKIKSQRKGGEWIWYGNDMGRCLGSKGKVTGKGEMNF